MCQRTCAVAKPRHRPRRSEEHESQISYLSASAVQLGVRTEQSGPEKQRLHSHPGRPSSPVTPSRNTLPWPEQSAAATASASLAACSAQLSPSPSRSGVAGGEAPRNWCAMKTALSSNDEQRRTCSPSPADARLCDLCHPIAIFSFCLPVSGGPLRPKRWATAL